MKDKETYFFTHTKDAAPTRSVIIPHYVKKHQRNRFFLHSLIAMLFGISVPYFVINFSQDVYSWTRSTLGFENNYSSIASSKVSNQGSEEVYDPLNDVPQGKEIPVNPDKSGQYYFLGPNYKVPNTSALAYVISDVETGEVIIEKNKDLVLPIASISKLITALVAQENMDMHDLVTVSRSSIETYGNTGGLRQNEQILVTDLFYPLLMESSNDAAEILAESFGKEAFIKKMNEKAKELGMMNTSFDESSGLSEKNVSTADDLRILMEYITKKHPEIWDITRVRQYAIKGHSWGNGSALARKSNFIGGKNGFTYEANRTTASIFEVSVEGGKRKIAVSLLKSNERESDVDMLLRFVSNWVGYLEEGEEL